MIPPNAIQIVKDLHATYVARTGYEIAYNLARENAWRDWCQFGGWVWTADDLARVIGYLRMKIRKGERNEGALKFANLIGRPDNFEEDLNLAREAARQSFGGTRKASRPREHVATEENEPMPPEEAAKRWREALNLNHEQRIPH